MAGKANRRDIVVIGGSTGAADVLKQVLSALPANYPASVFVVTHVPANGIRVLGQALSSVCTLPVTYPQDGVAIEPGQIYIAPPDRHLLLIDGVVRLGLGSKENMARPAIDPLFRSAALEFGPRVVGVVLTGLLGDGASGLAAIKQRGGVTLVQDPSKARAPDMPRAALAQSEVDHVVDVDDIAEALINLVGAQVGEPAERPHDLVLDVEIALGERLGSERLREFADPVAITCPTCQGVLSEVRDAQPLRFRCQTGHAFTGDTLVAAQEQEVEQALRIALRVVEERIELVDRLRREAEAGGRNGMAEIYRARTVEYKAYAQTLRKASIALLRLADVEQGD
jgi:two-component system chemotaxis response regulator CheB